MPDANLSVKDLFFIFRTLPNWIIVNLIKYFYPKLIKSDIGPGPLTKEKKLFFANKLSLIKFEEKDDDLNFLNNSELKLIEDTGHLLGNFIRNSVNIKNIIKDSYFQNTFLNSSSQLSEKINWKRI